MFHDCTRGSSMFGSITPKAPKAGKLVFAFVAIGCGLPPTIAYGSSNVVVVISDRLPHGGADALMFMKSPLGKS